MSPEDPRDSTAVATAPPGLLRRLASIFYDSLVLVALLLFAAASVVMFLRGQAVPAEHPAFQVYLLAVSLVFFCGFWIKGGQTVGMRAWRVRVVRDDGSPLRVRDAVVRFFAAVLSWGALGLGFLWILVDREKRAWHDRLSRTRLVVLEKPGKS